LFIVIKFSSSFIIDDNVNKSTTEKVKNSIDTFPTTNIPEVENKCQNYLIIKNDITNFYQEGEGRSAFGMTDTDDARNLFLELARSECTEPNYNYDFNTISKNKFYEISHYGLSYVSRTFCNEKPSTRIINLEKNIFVLNITDMDCLNKMLENSNYEKSYNYLDFEESASYTIYMNHNIIFLGLIFCITPVFFDMV
jgi:hypothetical protein